MASDLADPAFPCYWSITTIYWRNWTSQTIILFFAKSPLIFCDIEKVDQGILLNKLNKSELMVKSMCGYTIFYQTDKNSLPSIEQHQVMLKLEVAYPKGQR